MGPTELELTTTQDLIAELLRRPTFLGIVVHSVDEQKGDHWAPDRRFQVRFNENLQTPEAARLLDVVADHMSRMEDCL
jgi:hypothetical protein